MNRTWPRASPPCANSSPRQKGEPAERPDECDGITEAEAATIAGRIVSDAFGLDAEPPAVDTGDLYAPIQPAEIATSRIGCDGYEDTAAIGLGVVASGTCDYEGEEVAIHTFANEADRDAYIAGAVSGRYFVKRPGFVLEVETQGLTDTLNDVV